jgi:SAM-dependent methyltransferase
MAELTSDPSSTTSASCCSTEVQASCCEPSEKESCCGETATAEGGCGCSAGEAEASSAAAGADIREVVREKYAEAACAAAQGSGSCCGPVELTVADRTQVFGSSLYEGAETEGATATALAASLGCGVPTAVADLHEGETVLDLGSGAGADVLISARRVGPTGRAIGLDMTDEMLELARANAAEAGVENVEFVKGYIEAMPLGDDSVDVIVSNCVLNLSGDKPRVFAEAARVLKPGGRFAISDVIAAPDMDDATRVNMAAYTGCIAGALTEQEFRDGLTAAGLIDIEIAETHRVHEYATSAIIRARKPEGTVSAASAVPQVELFEPAMCCQTGVCGPSVDQQLIDVREDLRWAEARGVSVARHNLSSDPDAFVANTKVTGLLAAFGEKALPALLVDGEVALHGRYPSRDQLANLVHGQGSAQALPVPAPSADGACGCGPGGC